MVPFLPCHDAVHACTHAAFTNNNTQIRLDAQKLAALDFRTGLPSHQFDHGPPVTRAELKAFADSLAV
jgi:hypothetical protein